MWIFVKGRRRLRVEQTTTVEPDGTVAVVETTDEVVDVTPVRFDPGAANVQQVLAYLAANPADRRRVLAAERRGKARKGILGGD